MNLIKKICFALILFSVFFVFKNEIKAETLVEVKHDDIWFYRNGAGIEAASARYAEYFIDGKVAYCVQPGVQITTHNYNGNIGFVNSPWTTEQNLRISLIAYYGYEYPGHQTLRYKMATQFLIWKYLSPQHFNFYTQASGWGDHIDVSYEENQILSLVNDHYTNSSFADTTIIANLGEQITITDSNNVLYKYNVVDSEDYDAIIEGNKLKITPKKAGNITVSFEMKSYTDTMTTILMGDDNSSQRMGVFGLYDPAYFDFDLKVVGGRIKLKKVDSETNSIAPQGQAILKGAKYQVIDASGNVVETLTIGEDNTATSGYLAQGTYTIKEIESSTGYYINNNVYTVEINSSDIKEITVTEDVIKGRIKLIKYDSENNSCSAKGQATLKGAKYQVIDSKGNVVDTLTIGDDCTSTSKLLPYGNYTIKEISASTGYLIDTNVYSANIVNSNTINITSKEIVMKGRIKLTKYDNETNSCTSQGQAVLKGAKYQVIDAGGNVVDTLTIGDDCTATSKLLPYGNYTVKEISASTGYLIDTNVYSANINSNNVVINTTSKEAVIKGRIKLTKYDSETNSCTSQGQAVLKGAKYQVIDSGGNVVDTLTIGDDCTATSKLLPYGNYTVKEISASTGYLIDTNVYNANINSNNIVIDTTSKEIVMKGRIKLTKYDNETNSCTSQGQAILKGAKYQVIDSKGNVVDTLTIGDDCTATSKLLPYGNYKIKEISASTGYLIDTNVYSANINSNDIVINTTSKEAVIKGRIKLTKHDSETNSCTSQGQAVLKGAVYQITDYNNNVVDTLTIGEDCTATSKLLPYGNYKIKETLASTGYEIDNTVYDATVTTNEQIIEITSKEQVIKNFISILKQYDYVNETTQFLNAEAGIIFEIYYPDGTKYNEIKTDKNGYATMELPYGTWKFHQLNTTTGFEKIYDFFIIVDENSPKEHYYNILNNKLSAYLQVLKIDSETGKRIAIKNTSFKIKNTDTNQFISQYVAGKVLDTFYTDENGVMMTYLKLEAGNYKLIEVDSPQGYLINSDGLEFTIGDGTNYTYTTYGAVVTISFKNSPVKGRIEIVKKGEDLIINNGSFSYDEKYLSGIEFEIYAEENILSSDKNVLFYQKDQLVEKITTNSLGNAISKKLPLGKYYIVETKTLDNYVLDSNKYSVELKEIDNKTPIVLVTYDLFNYIKKGKLEFTKTDLVNGTPIPNVEIAIYNEQDKEIFKGLTDENGKIVINDLAYGKYYIIETEAKTGYVLTEEKIFFEIKEDGEIIKAEMTNKPIEGKLEFTKTDLVDGTPLDDVEIAIYNEQDEEIFKGLTDENGKIVIDDLAYGKYYIIETEAKTGYVLTEEKIFFEIKEDGEVIKAKMTNKPIESKLEFTKTDLVDGTPLADVEIAIYNEQDEEIFKGLTDENGKIVIDDLAYGKYYIIETEAKTGYVLTEEKIFFEIKEDGEIVKAEMTNKPIEGKLEFTKIDLVNGTPIPNVEFEIYKEIGEESELIFSGLTDENGMIILEKLKMGKYFIIEKNPAENYILNYEKLYFEIAADGEVIKETMTNEKIVVDVPDTEAEDNHIPEILGSILILCGIGVIVLYAKKEKRNK